MIDEECLREINDGVFGLRDSLDRRIRQLGDIRRALDATECGLADMQDTGGACGAAILRLLLRYLQELENDMRRHTCQIEGLEAAAGTKGVNFRQKNRISLILLFVRHHLDQIGEGVDLLGGQP